MRKSKQFTAKGSDKTVKTRFNRCGKPTGTRFISRNYWDFDVYNPIEHGKFARVTDKRLAELHNFALSNLEDKLVKFVRSETGIFAK